MAGFLPSLETFAKGTLATAATLSTVGAGLLYYGQNYLIYPSAFPPGSRTDVPVPSAYGLPYTDLELKTSDGITLRCYMLPQSKELSKTHPSATPVPGEDRLTEDQFMASSPTVIMFHGNGGNHGHRIPLAKVFYLRMRCNVLMVSYRGYGLSDGSPSEKGLQIDAQTALDYITSDPCFSKTPIILYGQSIGGAVSIDLASRNPSKIAALILENTFTSLPSLVPHALPLLGPFSFMCHQKWDSASKVPLIPPTTPILMLSGVADELVPKEHMRALWEIVARREETKTAGGVEFSKGLERAKYIEFERGGHNDTCVQPGYWTAVADFVADLNQFKSEQSETKL
ncbi:Alpha/Beta hydrolase protein [Mycena albidolilacea]|uniref:Alpha/Beta hydrolase protein n=1 Tax=Mycena albidolilacea TaxID=1033008 RepID=A0AAD7A3F3_9AGAR|nr:Alpha/Beta hydrolase protein [Mycena albidolilacea]